MVAASRHASESAMRRKNASGPFVWFNGLLDRLSWIDASGGVYPPAQMPSKELTDLALALNGISKLREGNRCVVVVGVRLDVEDVKLGSVVRNRTANVSNRLLESAAGLGQGELIDGVGHIDEA